MAVTEKRLHELESEVAQIAERMGKLERKETANSGKATSGDGKLQSRSVPISLLFSLLSLFISGFALWFSSLKPADIKVTLSSPEFEYQHNRDTDEPVTFPGGVTAVRHQNALALVGTCAFANNGCANIGLVAATESSGHGEFVTSCRVLRCDA